jgi:hypothetical protein
MFDDLVIPSSWVVIGGILDVVMLGLVIFVLARLERRDR